ncbi:MAG: orotate phosphoribosyltransferase [Candidatus Nanoarchaeia archaeon]
MEKKEVAKILLKKNAVTLNTENPYTYSSGIRSPIYCDNRLLAAFPQERKKIVEGFIDILKELEFDILGGTSTAGIQWAAWIAEKLEKPMCYIRGSAKKHGKGKQIEGAPVDGKKVVVIEDLISTGGSSFEAVEAVEANGGKVSDIVAIFTYELRPAKEKFQDYNVSTLTDFSTLAEVAKEEGYIDQNQLESAKEWNKNPKEWGPNHGFPNAK